MSRGKQRPNFTASRTAVPLSSIQSELSDCIDLLKKYTYMPKGFDTWIYQYKSIQGAWVNVDNIEYLEALYCYKCLQMELNSQEFEDNWPNNIMGAGYKAGLTLFEKKLGAYHLSAVANPLQGLREFVNSPYDSANLSKAFRQIENNSHDGGMLALEAFLLPGTGAWSKITRLHNDLVRIYTHTYSYYGGQMRWMERSDDITEYYKKHSAEVIEILKAELNPYFKK